MPIQRPLPIVEQVINILRDRIRNREFAYDGRLPSESELADQLGVSRATIRSALVTLATEGLILRKHGNGTYVNQRILDVKSQIGDIWEFRRLIQDSGFKSSIEPLSIYQRVANPIEIEKLDLSDSEQVFVVKRLFLADGIPVVLSKNVFPISLLTCDVNNYDVNLTLHEFVENYGGQHIGYAIANIDSVLANTQIAEKLNVDTNFPLIHFEEVFFNKDDLPIVYASNYYNDKTINLRLVRSWL